MPLTYAVTQYCPLHPTAQAYPAWSIHFMTAPPCTLPPKFTSVGSAKNRSVISRSLSGITVTFYLARPSHAFSVSPPGFLICEDRPTGVAEPPGAIAGLCCRRDQRREQQCPSSHPPSPFR